MKVAAVCRTAMVGMCLVAGTASLGAAQGAQATQPTRIAYVNTRQILAAAPGYAQAESTFTKEVEAFRAEVSRLQATMDSLVADFEQSSVMLSPTQRQAKQKDLQAKQEQFAQRTQELQQKAGQRERELLAPIQERVTAVIEGIRAEGNYAMIFDVNNPNTGIIAADKSLDLTQRVVQRLQATAKN
ncbi:MAG: OmpH family outer membrane protein [Gemmatimonadota bacterium]